MTLGEESAFNLGVSVEPIQLGHRGRGITAYGGRGFHLPGLIGFVGLIVPT